MIFSTNIQTAVPLSSGSSGSQRTNKAKLERTKAMYFLVFMISSAKNNSLSWCGLCEEEIPNTFSGKDNITFYHLFECLVVPLQSGTRD